MKITYASLKQDSALRVYITKADETLNALGYTEHSFAHVCKTAETAGGLLAALGFDDRTVEQIGRAHV